MNESDGSVGRWKCRCPRSDVAVVCALMMVKDLPIYLAKCGADFLNGGCDIKCGMQQDS